MRAVISRMWTVDRFWMRILKTVVSKVFCSFRPWVGIVHWYKPEKRGVHCSLRWCWSRSLHFGFLVLSQHWKKDLSIFSGPSSFGERAFALPPPSQ